MTIETEVRSSFDEWTKAWNEGDIERYLDGYYDDSSDNTTTTTTKPVRYVSGKTVVRGKDAISTFFRWRGAKGALSLVHFETNVISDTDVLCFGQYRLELNDSSSTSSSNTDDDACSGTDGVNMDNNDNANDITNSRKEKNIQIHEGCFTCHLKKIDNRAWKIISDHSS